MEIAEPEHEVVECGVLEFDADARAGRCWLAALQRIRQAALTQAVVAYLASVN